MAALPDIIGQAVGGALGSAIAEKVYFPNVTADPKQARIAFEGLRNDPGVRLTLVQLYDIPESQLDYLTPAQFLDLLSGGVGSIDAVNPADLDVISQNIDYLLSTMADNATDQSALGRGLAKNDGIRLLYSALISEMPDFQWTHIGMFVGGEVVRDELESTRARADTAIDLIESGSEAIEGIIGESAEVLEFLGTLTADQLADYAINKIVGGQVTVARDIGSMALAYRAAGGDADAAMMVARALPQGSFAQSGMTKQASADRAAARGNHRLAARLGLGAAIDLGIAEQQRLQDVLWDDPIISTVAKVMSTIQMVDADIPIPPLNRTIRAPGFRIPNPFGKDINRPQVWDLDYRIKVARNAFNSMYNWVHAPAARGERGPVGLIEGYVDENHWRTNSRPYWDHSGNDNGWGDGFTEL